MRPLERIPPNDALEQELIFLGLVGMMDPPRPEVRQAVQRAQSAGIRPVMITGDHPLTATAIANDLGLGPGIRALTGTDLNRLSPGELESVVENIPVFARVSPEHKLRIVEALQKRGHIVAMTGDGVNDAPALKKADIGVAMGITGTDVSKEAADMVLRDDNFATIVAAVEEGRVIYDNVRRFVKFSSAGNIGKVGVLTRAGLLAALSQRSPTTRVAEVMQRDFIEADEYEMLETAFARLQDIECHTMPVTHGGRVMGLLTMGNVGEFLMIQAALEAARQFRLQTV
jgi:Ca2+-transporting ATPase